MGAKLTGVSGFSRPKLLPLSQVTERGRVGPDWEVLYSMGGGLISRHAPRRKTPQITHIPAKNVSTPPNEALQHASCLISDMNKIKKHNNNN